MNFIDVKTSKGNFKVFDLIDRFTFINKSFIESGAIKLSEITENQCKEIIDSEDCESYSLLTMDWYECKLKYLLKSQGIQITDKTYILKV